MRISKSGKLTIFIFIWILIVGCSSQKSNPVTSIDDYSKSSPQLPLGKTDESSYSLLGSYEMEIDIESLTAKVIPNRDLSGHLNITQWITPGIHVNSYNPVTGIVEVNITILNPYPFGGYDVRLIIYSDSAGHLLTNDDGWTSLFDIPAGWVINPYKAFAKNEPYRFFEGYGDYSEILQIKCPGGNFSVKFAIEASVGSNCEEPFMMENFIQDELGDNPGQEAQLNVWIYDWQNDVSAVMLDCPEITGGPLVTFSYPGSNRWNATIINSAGAPDGNYIGVLKAHSGMNIAYDIVMITVTHVELDPGYAVQIGGTSEDRGEGLAVDSLGNVLLTGYFESEVDFDPGTGTENRTAWSTDAYLAKYTNSGDLVWVRTWGGVSIDKGLAVTVDGDDNIVVTGNFRGTVDFDPGTGTENRTTIGNEDVFVSKFNSSGDFQWVQTWGGANEDNGTGVMVDAFGYVYVVGDFIGAVDFDPGIPEDWYTPTYYRGTFLSKFGSNGDFVWALKWDANKFHAIKKYFDYIYIAGSYNVPMDFNPDETGEDNLNPIGLLACCLIKLGTNGNYYWTDIWGGAEWDSAYDLDFDSNQNIFISGDFMGTVDFDPGTGVEERYSEGNADAFLLKVNFSGDFQWVGTWGADNYDYGMTVTVDNDDKVYVGGFFNSVKVDFDPGPGLMEIDRRGGSDGYISKFDNLGNFEWVRTFGKSGYAYGDDLAHDSNNNIFLAGDFSYQADFNPGPEDEIYLSHGGYDAFYLRIFPNGYWER